MLEILNILSTEQHTAPEWVFNPWLLVFYGWIGYNIYALLKAKKDFDTDKSGYLSFSEIAHYFKVESIPILFSAWLVPVGVYFGPALWHKLTEMLSWEWGAGLPDALIYILMGSLSALVQYAIKKISGN